MKRQMKCLLLFNLTVIDPHLAIRYRSHSFEKLFVELTQYKSIVKIQPTKSKSNKFIYCANINHVENECRKNQKGFKRSKCLCQ